ncbi:uncharacterized protein V6R79_018588 [Siganus canaliculatus]
MTLLLNMRTYLTLLWGASALFSVESMSASISTPHPDQTTKKPISVYEATPAVTLPPTPKPAELSVSATTKTTTNLMLETEEVQVTFSSDVLSDDTTAARVSTNTAALNASSSGPRLFHTSAAASPAASKAQPSHDTVRPTQDTLHEQSPTVSTEAAPAATSSAGTEAASSPQPPTTAAESASTSRSRSFSTSSAGATHTPVFTQELGSPSTFSASSEPASTSSPASTNERSTENTEGTSVFPTVSVTTVHSSTPQFTDAEESRSTAGPTTISPSTQATATTTTTTTSGITNTTGNATTAGIYIPPKPKRLPIPTDQSPPPTTKSPREASKSPPTTEDQTCSSRGVVKQCLIIIASLAALATIFMVSTIVLCTKLSARKYKDKKPQRDTEMMCISALLPERTYTYTRQRNPVSNGVLVMHMAGDSDEDGGDNVTLSSFLPENDRYV